MKKKKQKKGTANRIVNAVLGIAIVVLLAVFLYRTFDVRARWELHTAVRDIRRGRRTAEARETLRSINHRQWVLDALKEAVEDKEGTVAEKINLLSTLNRFKEYRMVRRAIDSKVLSTRRAATWLRGGDPTVADQTKRIALAWLKDQQADSRSRAVTLCSPAWLNIREAIPILKSILDEPAGTREQENLLGQALRALSEFKVKGLAPRILAIVKDPKRSEVVRGDALDALGALEDAPRDEVGKLAIEVVKDKHASNILRVKVLGVLRRPEYAGEQVWKALEGILLDPGEKDVYTQRGCLSALARTEPLDRFEKLILDRRVYRNHYFATRVDVASALAVLNVRKRTALEILCEYLVDDDRLDTQFLVREEAWMSYFLLTGMAYGVKEKELFRAPPRPLPNPEAKRRFLLTSIRARQIITDPQLKAVQAIVGDLAKMKQVRQTYLNTMESVLQRWKEEASSKTKPKPKPKPKDATKDK